MSEVVVLPQELREQLPEVVQAYIGALEQRLAAVEAQLAQHSQNSSRPPSSDPPGAPPQAGQE